MDSQPRRALGERGAVREKPADPTGIAWQASDLDFKQISTNDGGQFLFKKTHSEEHFGAGWLVLQPGGSKPTKPTKENSYVGHACP